MPSVALTQWTNDRMARLAQVDAQCAAVAVLVPPNPTLLDESLRGYTMLLSAHFQGFCRALYTECAQLVAAAVPAALLATAQAQFSAKLSLNTSNPTIETIRSDFERFGFTLDLATADPANPLRVTHLGHLNYWRNTAAHHKTTPPPPGVPTALTLADVRNWRASCDGLAASLDAIMHNELTGMLGVAPW
jgi:hypothetical protein